MGAGNKRANHLPKANHSPTSLHGIAHIDWTTSRHARYVGRVGALAVALGIGGALVTTPGVAWADDSPSAASSEAGPSSSPSGSEPDEKTTPTSSSSSSNSKGSPTDPTPQNPGSNESADETSAPGAAGGHESQSPTSQTVTSEDSTVTYGSSGGAHTSGDADELPESTPSDSEPADEESESGGVTNVDADEDLVDAEPVSTTDPVPPTGDDPIVQDVPDTHGTTPPLEDDPNTGVVALVSNLPSAYNNSGSLNARTLSSAAGTARVMTTPDRQLADLGAQLGAALALPTPQSIISDLQPRVTACLCGFLRQATTFFNTVLAPLFSGGGSGAGPVGPAAPAESPMLWALVGWVRRQATLAVDAFLASPLGRPIAQIPKMVSDFGQTPLGRGLLAQVTQFVRSCGPNSSLPSDLDRTTVVSGLTEPTDFRILTVHDGDTIDRIFIAEKAGAIKVYDPATGSVTTLTVLGTTTGGERGLAGIEIHPDFWHTGTDGYHTIYAAYTSDRNFDTLARLRLSDDLISVVGPPKVLIESTELANNFHHGGELAFDPKGEYLYWSVGENTTPANAQNLGNIHGKVLRLNPDGTVPSDNPFVKEPKAVGYIYAFGFRNPFRFTFTPTGQLLVADVGEADWEELNLVTKGSNYGWPGEEGACTDCATVNPIYQYHHSGPPTNTGAITAVAVYDGDSFPDSYQNTVFIADYSLGWIKTLKFDKEYTSLISSQTFWGNAGATVKLSQGPDGNLYQLTIYPGELSVISPSDGNRAPTAVIGATQTNTANKSLEVGFTGSNSTDPDGDDLTYLWNFGDGTTSTEKSPTRTFSTAGAFSTYAVTLTVSDGAKTSKATQTITVGSTPPTATIEMVDDKITYNAGDTLTFKVADDSGLDPEDGPLPASAYKWTVVFHHNEHTHPFVDNIDGPTGTITVPRSRDQLASTFYRITLTVTDSSGLKTTTSVDVHPNTVDFSVNASNPGAAFTIDGTRQVGSFSEKAVVGVQYVVDAPSTQSINGSPWIFGSWSDGQPQSHTITVPANNAGYSVSFLPAPALLPQSL
jgi:glucose/arabinose dehydrogenase